MSKTVQTVILISAYASTDVSVAELELRDVRPESGCLNQVSHRVSVVDHAGLVLGSYPLKH